MEKYVAEEVMEHNEDEVLNHELYVADKKGDSFERLDNLESITYDVEKIGLEISKALDELVLSGRSPKRLAGVHSKIVSLAYSLLKNSSKSPALLVPQLLSSIVKEAQLNLKKGDHHYTNEVLFEQFGKAREKGVISDLEYLMSEENHSPNVEKKHYSNALLDNTYGIDYVTAVIDRSNHEVEFNLVQVKSSGERMEKRDRDQVIMKHLDFIKRYNIAFEDFQIKEASAEEVNKLTESVGSEKMIAIREGWDMAQLADSVEEAEGYLNPILNEHKESVLKNDAYKNSSNISKYSYVTNISKFNHIDDDPMINSEIGHKFKDWQNEWLSEINVKKERVLKPVSSVKYRAVVYIAGGDKEVYTIGE